MNKLDFIPLLQSLKLKNNAIEKRNIFFKNQENKFLKYWLISGLGFGFLSIIFSFHVLIFLFHINPDSYLPIICSQLMFTAIFCGAPFVLESYNNRWFHSKTKKLREFFYKKKTQQFNEAAFNYLSEIKPILNDFQNQTLITECLFDYFRLGTPNEEHCTQLFLSFEASIKEQNLEQSVVLLSELSSHIKPEIFNRMVMRDGFKAKFPNFKESYTEKTVDPYADQKNQISVLTKQVSDLIKATEHLPDREMRFKLKNILEEKLPTTLCAFCAIKPEAIHKKNILNHQSPIDIFNQSLKLITQYLDSVRESENFQCIKTMQINQRHIEKFTTQ